MVQIVRNVGGIQGLHVATEVFTESAERRLFELGSNIHSPNIITASTHHTGKAQRNGESSGPQIWPVDMFKVCNVIGDCGLFPGYICPDYCLSLNYPPGAGFQHHFDSRYRWGETVVGVSLGQPSTIYFQPGNAKQKKKGVPTAEQQSIVAVRVKEYQKSDSFAIEVTLPRRSIYVMSGASRVDWKHGIRQQPKNIPQTTSWNPHAMRRSLTLRATKPYSDVCLERLVEADPYNNALKQRLLAQQKFKPETQNLERDRQRARELIGMLENMLPSQARFRQDEVTFPLPPEAVAASNTLSSSFMGSMLGMGGGGGGGSNTGFDFSDSTWSKSRVAAAAGTANINRFPGGGNVMSTTSPSQNSSGGSGNKKRKSNGNENQKLSPDEMRRRRLDRFSPEKKKEVSASSPAGKGSLGGGGAIDLTNSSDEEEDVKRAATNSDVEDEQLRQAIALSMK